MGDEWNRGETQGGSKGRKSPGPARPRVHLRALRSLGRGAADGQWFTDSHVCGERGLGAQNSEGLVSPSMMAAVGEGLRKNDDSSEINIDNKSIWVHVVSLFSSIET